METIETEIPEKLGFLFEPSRYKVPYGGRGSAKSWSVAKALLIRGTERPQRALCAREIQRSISDSVHALLADQVRAMNMGDFYEVQANKILARNKAFGSSFGFAGLRHNVTEIKSYEGADVVWVEEAQAVSDKSWNTLIPTIRKDDSEIWVTFNPELEDDPTYQRFVVNPPPDAIVRKINWRDNPWFPEVLNKERMYLKERDPDAYQMVWEGNCRLTLDGAVYANEFRRLKESNRVMRVPWDRSLPVHLAFDLGWGDSTAIWCVQKVGAMVHVIDYIEDRGRIFADYIKEVREKGYLIGKVFLPHDGEHKNLQTGKSIKEVAEKLGLKAETVDKLSVYEGIEAGRRAIDLCLFDDEGTEEGRRCLSRYQYKLNEDKNSYSRHPDHNWASHGADAWRYLAIMIEKLSMRSGKRLSAPIRHKT